jgi:hypothetical protein
MKMKHKVLWIEDGALTELPDLIGPVFVDGKYDLTIASTATEGIENIMQTEFSAVIIDIRLPPGSDKRWINVYSGISSNKAAARLGLLVLRSLLRPEKSEVKLNIPSWIRPEVFGVFTVENRSEISEDLDELKIRVFRQKNIKPSVTTLLELIKEVINHD